MNTSLQTVRLLSTISAAVVLGGCANLKVTHVAPGESINAALAQKAELIRLPVAAPAPLVAAAGAAAQKPGVAVPAVEPELPGTTPDERVAEAYSRGEFCLGAGKDDEAIAAFEDAVKIDPAFTEAWQHLAMLYEKKGDTKKALEAFRRAKKMAQG